MWGEQTQVRLHQSREAKGLGGGEMKKTTMFARNFAAVFSLLGLFALTACSPAQEVKQVSVAELLPKFCQKLNAQIVTAQTSLDVIDISGEARLELVSFLPLDMQSDPSFSNTPEDIKAFDAGVEIYSALASIDEAFFDDAEVSKIADNESVQENCAIVGTSMESWASKSSQLLPGGIWSEKVWKKYIRENMVTVGEALLREACEPSPEAFRYQPDFSMEGSMYAIFDGRPYWAFREPSDYVKGYSLGIDPNNDGLSILNCPPEVYDNYLNSKVYAIKSVIRILRSQGIV